MTTGDWIGVGWVVFAVALLVWAFVTTPGECWASYDQEEHR